jgi:hypothetical protein
MSTDNKLTAVILSDPQRESGFEGKEITFTKPFPGSGRFAVQSTRPKLNVKLIFNLPPVQTI